MEQVFHCETVRSVSPQTAETFEPSYSPDVTTGRANFQLVLIWSLRNRVN